MRQHEIGKGKSGRDIRRTLKQVREAKAETDAEEPDESGTEIADSTASSDTTTTGDTATTGAEQSQAGVEAGDSQSSSRVMERLTDNRELVDRLQALKARQQRLPLDIDMTADDTPAKTRAKETRDELVERLLDPVLTLQETAILLDVCPTTVRRYTNRGVLNCFRTPGNQRRFRLSDVISFMERRDTAD